MVCKTSSVISFGCEVEKRTLNAGLTSAVCAKSCAKFTVSIAPSKSPPEGETFPSFCEEFVQKYESTFCPNRVTSRYPASKSDFASATIECASRLRSLPLVKGTTQNEHMLLQPRVIEIKAVIPLLFKRTGLMSA